MDYVLFHAKSVKPFRPCIDGIFSAYAAWLALPEAVLIPAMYGEENAPTHGWGVGDTIYLIDLTYPSPIIEKWADTGAKVIILDHHKQAMQDLQYLSDRVSKTFDMQRSGAVIAWEYFHPHLPIPELFQYVQDRDIWTKKLPGCDLINFALVDSFDDKSFVQVLITIHKFMGDLEAVNTLNELGQVVQKQIDAAIDYAVRHHGTRCVMGNIVPYFFCRTKREFQAYSDIGHALCKAHPNAPFAIVQTGDGWGLRSAGRSDVASTAKLMGGGGHVAASGCRAELPAWIAGMFVARR